MVTAMTSLLCSPGLGESDGLVYFAPDVVNGASRLGLAAVVDTIALILLALGFLFCFRLVLLVATTTST